MLLKYVGLFGVRRRINQIVDILNGDSNQTRLGMIETTMNALAAKVTRLEARVHHLERGRVKDQTFKMLDDMARAIDEEGIDHALEQVESLDERVAALETQGNDVASQVLAAIRREIQRAPGV